MTSRSYERQQVRTEIDRLWADHFAYVNAQRLKYPEIRILEAVAAAHGLTVADLRGRNRARRYSIARHHAAWELRRRRLDLGLQQIAAQLDRTDHTTAHHSYATFAAAVGAGLYAEQRARVAELLDARDTERTET